MFHQCPRVGEGSRENYPTRFLSHPRACDWHIMKASRKKGNKNMRQYNNKRSPRKTGKKIRAHKKIIADCQIIIFMQERNRNFIIISPFLLYY